MIIDSLSIQRKNNDRQPLLENLWMGAMEQNVITELIVGNKRSTAQIFCYHYSNKIIVNIKCLKRLLIFLVLDATIWCERVYHEISFACRMEHPSPIRENM